MEHGIIISADLAQLYGSLVRIPRHLPEIPRVPFGRKYFMLVERLFRCDLCTDEQPLRFRFLVRYLKSIGCSNYLGEAKAFPTNQN